MIPRVVAALRTLVSADWGMFFYSDEAFHLCDVYSEYDAVFDVFPIFLSEFRHTEQERILRGVDFETGMRRGRGFENSIHDDKVLYHSAVFAEVWRPIRLRYSLELTASDGLRGWGSMQLQRSFDTRPFTEKDQAAIAPFNRHIAHALTAPRADVTQFAEHGHSAVLIADENGNIDLASEGALKMLSLAHGEMLGPTRSTRVPSWLMRLVANFARLWHGLPAPPSTMIRRNGAGLFVFKLYACGAAGEADGRVTVAVHIEHFAPVELQVEIVGYESGLSERQRQLCADLIAGYSRARIAQRMCVRESTVADHVREAYGKLGVHTRRELARHFGVRET
ncbi:helix-turn-helix transcriptional regulator [Caballeronia novacaledonica]|uniref:Response regulator transcription factor n=1 Tax=Caballeronia novacaledonica TaxID=1544861 RepID=A0AA37MV48_9BURK|nr:helix-turn-helix transcriptional regulator [Caballeronia novacaledonica]GJH30402.1 response regulator transcription factor [Caballeronia novacaledonica]